MKLVSAVVASSEIFAGKKDFLQLTHFQNPFESVKFKLSKNFACFLEVMIRHDFFGDGIGQDQRAF